MDAADASTIPEVVDIARRAGLEDIAGSIEQVHNHREDGLEPLDPDSAGSLVSFVVRHQQGMPKPYMVKFTSEGHMCAVWKFTKGRDLEMYFWPDGEIGFSYQDMIGDGAFRVHKQGDMPPDKMLRAIASLPAGDRPDWGVLGGAGRPDAAGSRDSRRKGSSVDWRRVSRIARRGMQG